MTDRKTIQVLGMMSGTSLDGLDIAFCEFESSGENWSYRILHTGFQEYAPEMRTRLSSAIDYPTNELLAFHEEYGKWLGARASEFLEQIGATPDAIASHGHTVHHRPREGYTFQLGSAQQIALVTGIKTIGDFRTLDVALGGQGAPLVPIGDRMLFTDYEFCLNLGGIANISFEQKGSRLAFDIGVANMLLNHLCQPLDIPFDNNGDLSRVGQLNSALLHALDSLPFYKKPYPKSTGYEWFRDSIIPLLESYTDEPVNQLHSAVHHIAGQIAKQLIEISGNKPSRILVTGGGAFNSYLIEVLQQKVGTDLALIIPDPELISFKEALVFAFLGALRLKGQQNVLASVTGARRDSCSGVIFYP